MTSIEVLLILGTVAVEGLWIWVFWKYIFRSYFPKKPVQPLEDIHGIIYINPEETIKDTINGLPCEIEYTDADGKIIGYWAYGSFDPELPYQGKDKPYPAPTVDTDKCISSCKHNWYNDYE